MYNYPDSTTFLAASQKGFCCWLEKGKLVLRGHHHYYYQVQGQMLSALESGATVFLKVVFFTNPGISILKIFFDEIFWTLWCLLFYCLCL